ncbi:MAG TPA: GIY-YIG nuclease family protein [Thermoanaerobaculia bacterium]|nr:GIY-YIG nuclease family protein [Thermoanaerobaculia bacterium]
MVYPRQSALWRSDGTRRQFFVYILSNFSMTLYTGVTNNLASRAAQHRRGTGSKFTSRYHFDRVVYYEVYDLVLEAIAREKTIKAMSRAKKIALVKAVNPRWDDLLSTPSGEFSPVGSL